MVVLTLMCKKYGQTLINTFFEIVNRPETPLYVYYFGFAKI